MITAGSFRIGNTTQFTPYERQGLCKRIKVPLKIDYKNLSENLTDTKFDENL